MPIGYSPDDVLEFESTIDEGQPSRIRWKSRALSVADVRKVGRLRREASAAADFDKEQSLLNEAILLGVVGWDRPEPLSPEALDNALTVKKKYDFAAEYPTLLFLSEYEKKASPSQPACAAGSSAPAA